MLFNFSEQLIYFLQLRIAQAEGMECSFCLCFLGNPNLEAAGQSELLLPFLPALFSDFVNVPAGRVFRAQREGNFFP